MSTTATDDDRAVEPGQVRLLALHSTVSSTKGRGRRLAEAVRHRVRLAREEPHPSDARSSRPTRHGGCRQHQPTRSAHQVKPSPSPGFVAASARTVPPICPPFQAPMANTARRALPVASGDVTLADEAVDEAMVRALERWGRAWLSGFGTRTRTRRCCGFQTASRRRWQSSSSEAVVAARGGGSGGRPPRWPPLQRWEPSARRSILTAGGHRSDWGAHQSTVGDCRDDAGSSSCRGVRIRRCTDRRHGTEPGGRGGLPGHRRRRARAR